MNEIICGDSKEVLKTVSDESVDLLCTDPPYGYSFMGKSWDKTLPDIGIFKECLRVLKPGAFAFVMSAPRSDVCARMMLLLEDAGFNIGFTPIYWTYASGFPKAMNIGKMVDKRNGVQGEVIGKREAGYGPMKTGHTNISGGGFLNDERSPEQEVRSLASEEAKALDGSYGGFQPKPAVEVIIVAMKPLSEKTFVDQALKNGKGITWLDDCRVPIADRVAMEKKNASFQGANNKPYEGIQFVGNDRNLEVNASGRFPANLLVSDDVLNDGEHGHSAGKARGGGLSTEASSSIFYGNKQHPNNGMRFGDSGGYSRFFSLDSWAQNLPFLQVPKASKREKNEGLETFEKKVSGGGRKTLQPNTPQQRNIHNPKANHHPTVKPLTLMSYLITLGSRPGDIVLDPFLGSGTTVIAAKQLGRQYIGIEREKEYIEIAEARLNAVPTQLL